MEKLSRRRALELLAASGAVPLVGCTRAEQNRAPRQTRSTEALPPDSTGAEAVSRVEPLQRIWQTTDPFLFCAHHLDAYPRGNAQMGPAAPLTGHDIGRDFGNPAGWNMYHGDVVPGFPRHPHRGFETVTVVRTGLLDHSDSLGATARYGEGDVQWLTAGAGIMHAEMFPLLEQGSDNPLELFQIWLNLPSANKMVEPHFSMLWKPTIPTREVRDAAGRRTKVTIVAGRYDGTDAADPAPRSWAAERDNHVAIWTLQMEPGARFTLPAAPRGTNRSIYFHRGTGLEVGGRRIPDYHHVALRPDTDVALSAGPDVAEILMLQGKPIGEPIARHGPFVMNTDAEIRQAYADYQRTQFGGWPWTRDDPVHPRPQDRFARRPDGEIETPT
jgi:redox-sensitive bicupin YhaK (pirin superfamily)